MTTPLGPYYHGTRTEFLKPKLQQFGVFWLVGNPRTAMQYGAPYYHQGNSYLWEVWLKPGSKVLNLTDTASPIVQELIESLNVSFYRTRPMTLEEWPRVADFGILESQPWVPKFLRSKRVDAVVVEDTLGATPIKHKSIGLLNLAKIESASKTLVPGGSVPQGTLGDIAGWINADTSSDKVRLASQRIVCAYLQDTSLQDYVLLRSSDGDLQVHLLLIERSGTHYAVRIDAWGHTLSYGVFASGPSAKADLHALASALEEGVDDTLPPLTPVEGAQAPQGLLQKVVEGRWALTFPEASQGLETDFLGHLKRTLQRWVLDGSGRDKRLGILKHPYWPEFHRQVTEALSSQYGSSVTLYRGVHGEQAKEDLGTTLPVWRYSSWTTSRKMAKDFATFGYVGDMAAGWAKRVRRGTPWAVFGAKVPVDAILFAPVSLPGFVEPDILVKLLTKQDEFVVSAPALYVRGKVVVRS